jgi:hypothetical protein
MTFVELWQQIETQNPSFKTNPTTTMSVAGLKKAVNLGYIQGYRAGADMAFEAAKRTIKGEVPEFLRDLMEGKH